MNRLALLRRTARVVMLACLGATAPIAAAQDLGVKAPAQQKPVAIIHVEVQPVTSELIADGFIKFDKGVITGLGDATSLDADGLRKDGYEVIDLSGQSMRAYPGLIAPYTQLGLTETSAVRATIDYAEVGSITPEVRSVVAVNPDSTLIPVTRTNGVLLAGVFPITTSSGLINYFDGPGGLIPGRAGVIRLDGWTWEDMTVLDDAGVVVNWPQARPIVAWWMNKTEAEQQKAIDEQTAALERFFTDARAYVEARAKTAAAGDSDKPQPSDLPTDLRFEAMRSVLGVDASGKPSEKSPRPVYVLANDRDQITQAVQFCVKHKVRCVIVGGHDSPQCAELLKRHNVTVIVPGTIRFPKRDDSAYDEAFALPAKLEELGVRWTLASGEEAAHERNLAYAGGLACAYGLPPQAAVKALTIGAASALGVAERYGSLEPGKSATLIVCDGDPLELTTRVRRAFIDGRAIDLSNKQTELDRKYREKYRQTVP